MRKELADRLSGVWVMTVGVAAAIALLVSVWEQSVSLPTAFNDSSPGLSVREQRGESYPAYLPDTGVKSSNFLFFGDMMLDRHIKEKIEEKNSVAYLFEKMSSTERLDISDYDLVLSNLEGAVSDGGEHYPPVQIYDFAFDPETIAKVNELGFNSFTLANNHFADQGKNGIIETRSNLDELGIFYIGCPDRIVDDCSVNFSEFNGKRIALLGFSMVYGLLDEDAAVSKIGEAALISDLTIVFMHWGLEYEHEVNAVQKRLARLMVAAGADVIIGHHPHVIQGIEIVDSRPVFYSLGNFIFDQYFSSDTQEGLALDMEYNSDGVVYRLFPFRSEHSQPGFLSNDEKNELLNKIAEWSPVSEEIKIMIQSGKIKIK